MNRSASPPRKLSISLAWYCTTIGMLKNRIFKDRKEFSALSSNVNPLINVDDEKRFVHSSICDSSSALGTEKLCNAPQIIDKLPVLLVSLRCFRVPENCRGMNRHKDIRCNVCVPGFSLQLG